MFCRNCGSQIDDGAAFCPHCGVSTDPQAALIPQQQPQPQPQPEFYARKSGIITAAKVFIIIGMVCGCWMILPLIFGALGLKSLGDKTPSIGISICVLLFCNIIGGILMLCARSEYN